MNIDANHVVTIAYTLKDDQGTTLDTSDKEAPFAYLHGVGQMIPGLEEALSGKVVGDKFQVSVPPEKGYGEVSEGLVQSVPRAEFADVEDLAVGMQFQIDTENGPMIVVVVELKGDEVVLDANHPLAGETLHFDLEVVDVREATTEELEHGHVHGPGGHQH